MPTNPPPALERLAAQLDADRLAIESSLIAHRTLIVELLARQFAGRPGEFAALMDECVQRAHDLAPGPGHTEASRHELAAHTAARLQAFRQEVIDTSR